MITGVYVASWRSSGYADIRVRSCTCSVRDGIQSRTEGTLLGSEPTIEEGQSVGREGARREETEKMGGGSRSLCTLNGQRRTKAVLACQRDDHQRLPQRARKLLRCSAFSLLLDL